MLLYVASLSLSYPSVPHFLSHFPNLSHLLIDLGGQTQALLLQRYTRFHGNSATVAVVLCSIVFSPLSTEEKKLRAHTHTEL